MESKINAYLTFNGNCKEAMQFYKECLGGEINFQTVGETPLSYNMPVKMKDCILYSSLKNGAIELIGSDMVDEKGLLNGNAISILLNCNNEEEMKDRYFKLSNGGEATNPPAISYWGALFGNLIDKFGNHWILNCNKP